jgi:alkylated DNA repair dioxygenase AlkB
VARYGANPSIASVSFGAERAFQKCNEQKVEFSLGGGAVLLMSGTAQATWQHSVPKRAGLPGARINLTFRRVLTAEDHAAAKRPRR